MPNIINQINTKIVIVSAIKMQHDHNSWVLWGL